MKTYRMNNNIQYVSFCKEVNQKKKNQKYKKTPMTFREPHFKMY